MHANETSRRDFRDEIRAGLYRLTIETDGERITGLFDTQVSHTAHKVGDLSIMPPKHSRNKVNRTTRDSGGKYGGRKGAIGMLRAVEKVNACPELWSGKRRESTAAIGGRLESSRATKETCIYRDSR